MNPNLYLGLMEKLKDNTMETTIVNSECIGIVEKKMETTTKGLGFTV